MAKLITNLRSKVGSMAVPRTHYQDITSVTLPTTSRLQQHYLMINGVRCRTQPNEPIHYNRLGEAYPTVDYFPPCSDTPVRVDNPPLDSYGFLENLSNLTECQEKDTELLANTPMSSRRALNERMPTKPQRLQNEKGICKTTPCVESTLGDEECSEGSENCTICDEVHSNNISR